MPNLFLASVIFFGLVALARNVKIIYTGSIVLFIAYLLSDFLVRDIENKNLVKLLDPFALNTVDLTVKFFTPVEKNNMIVPFEGYFVMNRVIWGSISLIILCITYFGFSFKRFFAGSGLKQKLEENYAVPKIYSLKIPKVSISFAGNYYRKIMFNLARIEFLSIVRDNYFRAILLGGVIFLSIDYWIGNQIYSVSNYPLTVNLMEYKNWDYVLFIFIIIIFYTGETVHRDQSSRFAIINDALPTPDWVLYGSKLLGLVGLAFTLATFPLIIGIIVQLLQGFTDFRFDVYFTELYLITFPQFIQMIMLAFAVHMIVNNKFAGHAVGLLIWIVMWLLRTFAEMDYNLFFYSYAPNYIWSDMDGVGHMAKPVFWFNFYWVIFGSLLLVIAALFYNRGVVSSLKERWKLARQRFTAGPRLVSAILLLGFIATGTYNYYQVSYVNNYLTRTETEERQVVYEKTLKKFEKLPQLKIVRLKIVSDIFPNERKVMINGLLNMVNKSGKPVSTLHFDGEGLTKYSVYHQGKPLAASHPLIYKRGKFNWFRPANDTSKYHIYQLPVLMQPGDSTVIEVRSEIAYKGFTNSLSGTDIVHNGTFFAGGLPGIGYDDEKELLSDEKRKKHKLPEKKDEYPVYNDPVGVSTLLFNDDADLVAMDITVSTVEGQIAVAPGDPVKEWTKNGRRYFRYVQDQPQVDLFFDVVSARYSLLKDKVKLPDGREVKLELYHHPSHNKNTDRFMNAYKDGLVYFSKAYGPFQFKQMRMLEFPKYRAFAQSFPNTVSYSEGFGWTADFRDPDKFDYAYFVTAHELAHQWWGHQVVPNRTRGSNLISEALAEYTALLLTEKKYGKDNMKRFLKEELERYLRGRANEAKKENVFIDCNRPYQWYQKGALILYGLKDLIGEDKLNSALRAFSDEFAFRNKPPYAGSHDLYRHIQNAVPDSLQYYLTDTWEKITLYENKVIDATVNATGKKNEYIVNLTISTRKFYADSAGTEKPAPAMNDYMDIGIFAAETKNKEGRTQTNPLYIKKHRFTPGKHTLEIIVKGKPVKTGIDPYIKLIDRIPDDNVKDL